MLPARATPLSYSFSSGISGDLRPVPAQIHAAPYTCALLADVVKMENAAFAFSNARRGRSRQQIGERIGERLECVRWFFGRKICAPLKTRVALDDPLQVRMGYKQPVEVFHDAWQNRIPMFHRNDRLPGGFPEPAKFFNTSGKLRRRPTVHQSPGLTLAEKARDAEPARQCAAIGQHLHCLTVHDRPCVEEIKQQLVTDKNESVAPIAVHLQPHSFSTKMLRQK
jgi:hypothetical protein